MGKRSYGYLVLLGSFIYVPNEQGLFFTQTIIKDDLSHLMNQLLPLVTFGVLCFKHKNTSLMNSIFY